MCLSYHLVHIFINGKGNTCCFRCYSLQYNDFDWLIDEYKELSVLVRGLPGSRYWGIEAIRGFAALPAKAPPPPPFLFTGNMYLIFLFCILYNVDNELEDIMNMLVVVKI